MKNQARRAVLRLLASTTSPLARESHSGEIRKILVIRPDHIGDVLFTTPALCNLRRIFPRAHITLFVGPWSKDVYQGNSDVDAIRVCDFPGFSHDSRPFVTTPYSQAFRLARALTREDFDLALNLRFDFWWGALVAYLAGIPLRVGYDLPEGRPFLNLPVPYEKGRHEVAQNQGLIPAIPAQDCEDPGLLEECSSLRFYPSEADRLFAESLLQSSGFGTEDRLVVIHPGTGAKVKLWKAEGFACVGDHLMNRFGAKVLLTGSTGEEGLVEGIASRMRSRPATTVGETKLGELAALLERSALAVGVDNGPLHLAVALGVPTIHLFGPSDHVAFGPWGPSERHIVVRSSFPCSPCHRLDIREKRREGGDCMRAIAVEQVIEAVDSLLATRVK
ncbi:MAG: glycosyltransferase family 9 protein [Chloroflexi bacterium]|nr:glycosyltransferase family 9 protein [Chloroflexota bacterium]